MTICKEKPISFDTVEWKAFLYTIHPEIFKNSFPSRFFGNFCYFFGSSLRPSIFFVTPMRSSRNRVDIAQKPKKSGQILDQRWKPLMFSQNLHQNVYSWIMHQIPRKHPRKFMDCAPNPWKILGNSWILHHIPPWKIQGYSWILHQIPRDPYKILGSSGILH